MEVWKGKNETKLPSLDKILVKHVQEARRTLKKSISVLEYPKNSVVSKQQIPEKHLEGKDTGVQIT